MVRTKGDLRTEAYGRWVVKWRWPIVLLSLVATMLIASGGRFLSFSTNYRVFFSKENPQLEAYEALQNIYTKNDNILFVVAPRNGKVFTQENLAAVEELTEEAWKLPFSTRVDAVTNFQHTRAEGDELIVGDLVASPLERTDAELAEARAIALDEPFLHKRLIADDAAVTGVNVTLELDPNALDETPRLMAAARDLAQRMRDAHPDVDIYLTGVVALNNAFSESSQEDLRTLIPAMLAIILVVMWVLLRSVSATFATLLVVMFSAMSAMGLAGWLGFRITSPSASAPTMILTLAIADSIHLLVTMLHDMRTGVSKRDAIVESLRVNMGPVFLTSLTTTIGFLSMNFSDSPPFRDLGNIVAMGVTAAFVYSVVFLPALLAVLPIKVSERALSSSNIMERVGTWVVRRRRPLLWGGTALMAVISVFIARNELNDQFVQYFDERVQFRQDTDFTTQNLTGIYQLDYSIGANGSGGISDPEYLEKLGEFEAWFRNHPGVVNVNSFSEVMKRVNKSMHGDDPEWRRTPASRELAAQYLLLYEMSLPFGLDLNNQINVDKSATRVTVTIADVPSSEVRSIAEDGENWLRENTPPYMHATAASPSLMFAHISERNIKSMLTGTTLAIILISFILLFALRSLRFGLLSLIPNLMPAVVGFGIWGMVVAQVNIALSVVVGMTLGIVVDDTIHFLSKYLRARREKGIDAQGAVCYAFSRVGMALLVTTVILVSGFAMLAQSSFDVNAGMAKLTALTIALALALDLLFLPPLLLAVDRSKASVEEAAAERTADATV